MSFFSTLGRAIFDPANVTGAFDEGGGGGGWHAPQERHGYGMLGSGRIHDFQNQLNDIGERARNGQRMRGFMESMGASSDPRLAAFNPDVKVKPSDWLSQWSYNPSTGLQWIEPKRVSADNDVPWAPVVNNGPVKGNRI